MDTNITPFPIAKIRRVEKNKLEEFRISVTEYEGHKLLKCHVWYRRKNETEMRPGKQCIAVRVERARELIAALEESLKDAGL